MNKKGITFIEAIIVNACIGLLLTLVITALCSAFEKSKDGLGNGPVECKTTCEYKCE
jgi:Tfp pilus assembly protein PilE